jgi:hypothetical protein
MALDWNAAIEKHREALRRILATLVAMAGFPVLHACGGAAVAGGGATLPRHLHRALLALLRPAEAAARRLVIIAARGLVVEPAGRGRKMRGGVRGGGTCATPPRLGFRLLDPLPRWKRRVPQAAVPRISVPGFTAPFPVAVRHPPSPDDPVGAARLALRLQALGSVLDDLPRHARRFARWRAARAENGAPDGSVSRSARFRRTWPLRPGRPPGHRSQRSRRSVHAVHEVLDDLHGLAVWTLNDTS